MGYFKLLELKMHHASRNLLYNTETLKCGCCVMSRTDKAKMICGIEENVGTTDKSIIVVNEQEVPGHCKIRKME
jgi:hypothetical protein